MLLHYTVSKYVCIINIMFVIHNDSQEKKKYTASPRGFLVDFDCYFEKEVSQIGQKSRMSYFLVFFIILLMKVIKYRQRAWRKNFFGLLLTTLTRMKKSYFARKILMVL